MGVDASSDCDSEREQVTVSGESREGSGGSVEPPKNFMTSSNGDDRVPAVLIIS